MRAQLLLQERRKKNEANRRLAIYHCHDPSLLPTAARNINYSSRHEKWSHAACFFFYFSNVGNVKALQSICSDNTMRHYPQLTQLGSKLATKETIFYLLSVRWESSVNISFLISCSSRKNKEKCNRRVVEIMYSFFHYQEYDRNWIFMQSVLFIYLTTICFKKQAELCKKQQQLKFS